MNLRKNSRIQPAPMATYQRSIHAGVDLRKGRRHQGPSPPAPHMSQPSQPIPIKNFGPCRQDLEDELLQADSSSHYDWATWRMYERITNARRLRACSRGPTQPSEPATTLVDQNICFAPLHHVRHAREHSLQVSAVEEIEDHGVFALDDFDDY